MVVVRWEDGYKEFDTQEEAIEYRQFLVEDEGCEDVEIYDSVEDKFI